jgi:hypothetical protein
MPRAGGFRPGAGRPKGAKTDRTKAVAAELALTGTTPLEIMMEAIRYYADQGNRDKACSIAKDAAPYMHPRLTTVDVGNKAGVSFKGEQTVIILPPNARD